MESDDAIQGESVLSDHRGQVWNRLPDEQQVRVKCLRNVQMQRMEKKDSGT